MLVRGLVRLVAFIGPMLIILFVGWKFYDDKLMSLPLHGHSINPWSRTTPAGQETLGSAVMVDDAHQVVISVSTADKKYFTIDFGGQKAMNPNIIPHKELNDTWIIVALQVHNTTVRKSPWNAEWVCNAVFKDDILSCTEPPVILPIGTTSGDKCSGEMAFFVNNIGPHDARVFYGPKSPFAIYGSNSAFTCLGQWLADFRTLVDWGFNAEEEPKVVRHPVDLQRPPPYMQMEKNWFLFWDADEQVYVHYDVAPKRVFARLEADGSVGEDLAPHAALNDEKCMAKYMPQIAPTLESVHQATNSLSLTLCNRTDPLCEPKADNTFLFTIFQHKSFHDYHSVYEPYMMIFQQAPPFAVHAISSKPIWINGRGRAGEGIRDGFPKAELAAAWNQTEMLYVTSMSWKSHEQKYHGHIDDVLFLAFGIEDQMTGGIDIVVGELLRDLNFCLNS